MLRSIIIAGALAIAGPALASNFILGHGALAPVTASDYPPGHQVDGKNVSLPASRSDKPETRAGRK